jgi:hypothetical protein
MERAGRRTEVPRTVVCSVVGGLAGAAAAVDGTVASGGAVDDVTGSSVREEKRSAIVVDVVVVDVVASNCRATRGPDSSLSEPYPHTRATAAATSTATTSSARGISLIIPPSSTRQPSLRRIGCHRQGYGV